MKLIVAFFLVGWFGVHGEGLLELAFDSDCSEISAESCALKQAEKIRKISWASQVATFTTAACCALVGALLSRRRPRRWQFAALSLPLAGGLLNGALLVVLLLHEPAAVVAMVPFGLFYGVFYAPVAWLLCSAHFSSETPRALWRTTALVLAVWAFRDRLVEVRSSPMSGPLTAAAVAIGIALWASVVDWRALLRAQEQPEAWRQGPYRDAAVAPIDDVRPLLRRALRLDGLLLLGSIAMLFLCFGWPSPR